MAVDLLRVAMMTTMVLPTHWMTVQKHPPMKHQTQPAADHLSVILMEMGGMTPKNKSVATTIST